MASAEIGSKRSYSDLSPIPEDTSDIDDPFEQCDEWFGPDSDDSDDDVDSSDESIIDPTLTQDSLSYSNINSTRSSNIPWIFVLNISSGASANSPPLVSPMMPMLPTSTDSLAHESLDIFIHRCSRGITDTSVDTVLNRQGLKDFIIHDAPR